MEQQLKQPPFARWDALAESYVAGAGDGVDDPATASVFGLIGSVTGKTVVDLACAHGRVARELARRGAAVIGIDVSPVMLERARAAEVDTPLGIRYVQGDGVDVLPTLGMVDAVVCNFGLSDIDDLPGTLIAIAAALRAGGQFVFSILHPCFPGWDADGPSSWPPEQGYYAEGWWLASNTGYRGTVGANHRTLSTYLNTMRRADLIVDRLEEPQPGADWKARLPGAAPVPVFLTGRCRKAPHDR